MGVVDSRLIGIDLPRMKIEEPGLAVLRVHTTQHPAKGAIRQQPKVPSAAAWEDCAHQSVPSSLGSRGSRRVAGETGIAAPRASHTGRDGRDRCSSCTRVPSPAGCRAPRGSAVDGVARGAVAAHRQPREILENQLSPRHILAKLDWRELMDTRVIVAVARDLVAIGNDATQKCRVSLCDPAQDEERGLHSVGTEQIEHAVGAELDSRLARIPLCPRYRLLEGRNLEILLDVDRQGIIDRRGIIRVGSIRRGCSATSIPLARSAAPVRVPSVPETPPTSHQNRQHRTG